MFHYGLTSITLNSICSHQCTLTDHTDATVCMFQAVFILLIMSCSTRALTLSEVQPLSSLHASETRDIFSTSTVVCSANSCVRRFSIVFCHRGEKEAVYLTQRG